MSVPAIVFGTEAGAHVALAVTRRERPEAAEHWDRNWLHATVRIRVGAFGGEYEASLHTTELASLRARLTRLHTGLVGEASFESIEEWLRMTIVGDGRGHFLATCQASDEPGNGTRLHFEIHLDQTELPPVLTALDAVLAAFPVQGTP